MSLTGSLLLWIAWIVAIALFAWVVIDWPRSARRNWLVVLRRVGYQLAVVVTVLLAVGISLNREYGWYANWGDLGTVFDTGAPAGIVVAAGAAASDAAGRIQAGSSDTPGSGHQALPLARISAHTDSVLRRNPGPHGQYYTFTVTGSISGIKSQVAVWFPASYTDPKMATHRYPVIEAFPGVPGTAGQLENNMAIGAQVSNQVAAGVLADPVIVMPTYAPRQVDTECVDGGAGQLEIEQWITRDVTSWVERNVRVSSDRSSWATFGLSAGAWCASMLAMLHPDIYSAAISLGGYYLPTFEKPYIPFTPGSPQWNHYDLLRIAHDAPPKVALWVQTSKVDLVSYATTMQLLGTARPPLSVTADVLPNAGHRLGVWIPLIPQTLRWLGATVPGFRH